jgi:anti-sigma-K factor RskA
MSHKEYKEMLEFAALDALENDELRALEQHLKTCGECRAELSELRDVAATLVYLTPPVPAPARLRNKILEAITAPEMNRASEFVATDDDDEDERTLHETSLATSNVVPISSSHRKWSTSAWIGALAASIIFAILVVALIVLLDRNRKMQAEVARLSRRNEEMQIELSRLSQQNDEIRTELANLTNPDNQSQPQTNPPPNPTTVPQGQPPDQRASTEPDANEPAVSEPSITEPPVVAEPDSRVVALAGTDRAPQAHARLLYNNRTGIITLSVSSLPTPPSGKAYQLWYMVKGRPIPGAVFTTGPGGRAMMRGPIPVEARNATAFAVTLENQNGASKPTGDKYLLGAVS